VREARQSIVNLRSPKPQVADLADALRQAGERAIAGGPVVFKFAVSGASSPAWVDADEQLLRIGQEALFNAVRHAGASEVSVELRYQEDSVVLRVSDDGRGFDPNQVHEADGHCGLASMKERAEALGGRLQIMTAEGRGVEVQAVVPRC
jgi:signal transduction histidine kinase